MQATYLGHSCFKIEMGGKTLIFDPFIRPNELAANIRFEELKADYILVSHGHSDHTADLVDLARQTGATVVCSWEIQVWLNNQGITNIHPMNIGGKWKFDFGTVHMTFAAHSSSLGDGTYAGVAAGYVIESEGQSIYYSGDTSLHLDMKLTGEKHRLTAAFLPIGDNFTMDYTDACKAADFIGCNNIIAMHFDTFGFIKIDHKQVAEHFKSNNKTLKIPAIGETITI
jgi:L-ascorbate metabolism protein UlaG (beta-lactamase superfamily)